MMCVCKFPQFLVTILEQVSCQLGPGLIIEIKELKYWEVRILVDLPRFRFRMSCKGHDFPTLDSNCAIISNHVIWLPTREIPELWA